MKTIKRNIFNGIITLSIVCGLSFSVPAQTRYSTDQATSPDPNTVDTLSQQTGEQVWQNKIFTRNSFEEDIRDVLKAIARMNNTPVSFGEGIDELVTMEFRDMPLREAFTYIVNRYGLSYYWDAGTIHIYKPDITKTKDVLVQVKHLKMNDVKKALNRFGLLKKDIRIVFDEPTNTILLTGTEREIKNIQEVINVLESTAPKPEPVKPEIRYYPLKFARVDDIQIQIGNKTVNVKGMISILTEVLDLTQAGEKRKVQIAGLSGEHRQVITTQQGPITRKTIIPRSKVPRETPENIKDISYERESRAKAIKEMIETEAGTIASDSRTNQIIIRDYPEKLDQYAKIIEQLDQPTQMVTIDMLIVDAQKGFARELGVSWAWSSDLNKSGNKAAGATSQDGRTLMDDVTSEEGPQYETLVPLTGITSLGGLSGSFLWQGATNLAVAIAASEDKGVARLLKQTTVITMDNMKAIVEQKTTVTYKLQSGGIDQVVESDSIDAGIVVSITPHIIKTDAKGTFIELIMEVERSDFRSAAEGGFDPDGVPDKLTEAVNTQAIIPVNSTLVFGALFENRYEAGDSGIPILMDIPVLGQLFKFSKVSNPKINTVFFMTPRVVDLGKFVSEAVPFEKQIDSYKEELKKIDPDKQEKFIEKRQNF